LDDKAPQRLSRRLHQTHARVSRRRRLFGALALVVIELGKCG